MNGYNPALEPQGQSSEFINVEFVSQHNGRQATLRWLTLQSVVVAVRITGNGAEKLTELHWTGTPAQAAAMQATLTGLRNQRLGRQPEYELRLARQGQTIANLVWDAQAEPENLTKLRNWLEKIGHLQAAEAIAYQRRGCEVAKKGDLALAAQAFRAGIQALGDLYRDPDTIDDTGMKLVLADHNKKIGKSEIAMNLFARVLEARIDEYLRLHQLREQASSLHPC